MAWLSLNQGSKDHVRITCDHVRRVAQIQSRLVPYVTEKASDTPVVGKVFGLGVAGYLGSAIEIEAVAFPARAPGKDYRLQRHSWFHGQGFHVQRRRCRPPHDGEGTV